MTSGLIAGLTDGLSCSRENSGPAACGGVLVAPTGPAGRSAATNTARTTPIGARRCPIGTDRGAAWRDAMTDAGMGQVDDTGRRKPSRTKGSKATPSDWPDGPAAVGPAQRRTV